MVGFAIPDERADGNSWRGVKKQTKKLALLRAYQQDHHLPALQEI